MAVGVDEARREISPVGIDEHCIIGRKRRADRGDASAARPIRASPRNLRYSFDMLGEGAKTHAYAERDRLAYLHPISAIGRSAPGSGPIAGTGISVKLSALHPRHEPLQSGRCVPVLIGTLTGLAGSEGCGLAGWKAASAAGFGIGFAMYNSPLTRSAVV